MNAQAQDEDVREQEDVTEPEPGPEPEPRAPDRVQEIDGTAGHGVARAYGFIALAAAYGCKAELIEGSTRSGSKMKLKVAVYAPDGIEDAEQALDIVASMYEVLAPEAEKFTKERRDHVRHEEDSAGVLAGYEINRFSRAVLAGFLQGAAGVLKTEHAIKPPPYRLQTRARAVNEAAHRSGLSGGRAYAKNVLQPQLSAQAA